MSGRLHLRGGCVLTLGAKSSNLVEGDVVVDDGIVTDVGRGLHARDAEVVDTTDAIVMPGFVDAHRHSWTSLFRNLGERGGNTRKLTADVRHHYSPDDVYAAALVGLLGAAEAGITTVVDWCDLPLDDASGDALLRAHADSGMRTVVVPASLEPPTRELFTRLLEGAGPTTTVAFGSGQIDLDRIKSEWSLARELGLRIHAHVGADAPGCGWVAALAERGLLRDDVTLVHHTALDETDIAAIAASGASVVVTPSSEMATGHGAPPIQELMDRDLRPGLGIDLERVAPGDMFAQMRETISLQHATVFDRKLMGKGSLPRLMSTRDVIRSATLEGARATGLAGVTGSLEPGMQADLIVLRTDRPNIWPINDPIGAVVWGMDTSNIDRVLVGGRTVLRGGDLEADVAAAGTIATEARERVAVAAGMALNTGVER
ncbi:MAG TPA: amidohydrolase family protein [Actinomycetota bacterium]|nr:amidohydrolase family protein [Actinomycetota bacterium]